MTFLFLFGAFVNAQEREVTGTVSDTEEMTIVGATVVVKGTQRGTVTDIDGEYSIRVNPDDVLQFSFVGYESQEILVGDQTEINVVLEPDVLSLDEVVVVGYGVQERESIVGAVSQVSGDQLKRIRTGGSAETVLQGRLPGLTIISVDSTPGEESIGYYGAEAIQMTIRGTSAMGSNAPLVIVDGVERSFSQLDPNEIASVSILKDASATAVYGVKGANGVIIVNTKRGRAGALEIDFSADVAVKTPTILPEYMNAYETLMLRNEANRNDQRWDRIIPDEILQKYKDQSEPYLYRDHDWMDYYFKPGIDHSYNLNARGGTDFVRYFVSLGYLNEGDVFTTGDKFPYHYDKHDASYFHNRYTFRNNLDFTLSPSTTLAVNLGGNIRDYGKPIDVFTQERWFQSVTDFAFWPAEAQDAYPDERIPYLQNEIRPFVDPSAVPGTPRLIWEGGQGFWRHKANQTNVDVTLEQELEFITEGLSVAGTYSYNNDALYRQQFSAGNYYAYYLDPETLEWSRYYGEASYDMNTPQAPLSPGNDFVFQSGRSHYYLGRVNFNRTFNDIHAVTAVGIFSRRQAQGLAGFPRYEENWVARGTYNYDRRYFFESSIAHSGSEKFAPGLRFGTFPSFSGGWTLSNEEFFEPVSDIMNRLRFRYSLGWVGSDAGIPRWLYQTEYSEVGGSAVFGFPSQSYGFIGEGPVPVPDATWETARLQNLGVEMSFLNNFITLEVDLFNERRTDMLQTRQRVPSYVGVSQIRGNIGETKSHGIEVQLGVQHQFGNGLFLFFDGNIAANESRVVFWDESEFMPDHLKAEGKSVDFAARGAWGRGIMDAGYYQDFDELFMYPQVTGGNPVLGDLKFIDYDGDGSVGPLDRVVASDPIQPFTNWNATLGGSYRNWAWDFSFYGISRVQRPMRDGGMFYLFPFTQQRNNAYTAHADRWTPENRNPQFPTPHYLATDQYNYQNSQFSFIQGQYIRLRNARLSYRFELDAFQRIGLKSMELSAVGSNLWTWKRLPWGADPEGFNHGVDFGAYPHMKRYTMEVRVLF